MSKKLIVEWLKRFGVESRRISTDDTLTGEECLAFSLGLAAAVGTGKFVSGSRKVSAFVREVCAS